jgi:hypothetical protein
MVASKTIKQQEMRVAALRTEVPCCPAGEISVEFKLCFSLSLSLWLSNFFLWEAAPPVN